MPQVQEEGAPVWWSFVLKVFRTLLSLQSKLNFLSSSLGILISRMSYGPQKPRYVTALIGLELDNDLVSLIPRMAEEIHKILLTMVIRPTFKYIRDCRSFSKSKINVTVRTHAVLIP
jgi:hypothetical protein